MFTVAWFLCLLGGAAVLIGRLLGCYAIYLGVALSSFSLPLAFSAFISVNPHELASMTALWLANGAIVTGLVWTQLQSRKRKSEEKREQVHA
jgi:hypothetical protein